MQKDSSTRKRASKDTDIPAFGYTKSAELFRIGFRLTPTQLKRLFGFLKPLGLKVGSVDELHMLFFVARPEKKGGVGDEERRPHNKRR